MHFKEQLNSLMEIEMVDEVQYKQWVSTDTVTLETMVKKTDDFVDDLCDKPDVLLRHDFIAKQQSSFQTEVKERLQMGEFLVLLDLQRIIPLCCKMRPKDFIGTMHKPKFIYLCATTRITTHCSTSAISSSLTA